MISLYYFWHRGDDRVSMDDFIEADVVDLIRGLDMYSLDGETVAVDRVGRFEDLGAEMERLAAAVGLPETPSLLRENSSTRKERRHFTEVFTPKQIARIGEKFEDQVRVMEQGTPSDEDSNLIGRLLRPIDMMPLHRS